MTTPSNDISNNVYSKKTEHAGNGLFTSEDIAAGELILEIDRPFLAVLDTPRLNDACSNCFVWVPAGGTAVDGDDRENVTLRACTGCKVVKYCGKVGGGLFVLSACLLSQYLLNANCEFFAF